MARLGRQQPRTDHNAFGVLLPVEPMQRQVAQFHATAARAGRVLYIRYHVRHASFLAAPHPPTSRRLSPLQRYLATVFL